MVSVLTVSITLMTMVLYNEDEALYYGKPHHFGPIGQFAGYNIPTSLINTGDVGISKF